jgi:hypothetical protein
MMVKKQVFSILFLMMLTCCACCSYGTSEDACVSDCVVLKKKKYILQTYTPHSPRRTFHNQWRARYPEGCTDAFKWVGGIIKDVAVLQINMVSWDSFKVIASVFPFFIGARMLDEPTHSYFYDPHHHKNKNQLPHWAEKFAQFTSIGAPLALLGSQAIFSRDVEFQATSRMLLLGMPVVIWGKDFIKKAQFDACLRPWNEKFSCKQRAFGGFPSGHVAQASYTAVLYGMRYGPVFSIPLGLIAGAIGLMFVGCNRHLLSQVIAGAGFGAMYGIAANRLLDEKLERKFMKVKLDVNDNGGPALKVACRF